MTNYNFLSEKELDEFGSKNRIPFSINEQFNFIDKVLKAQPGGSRMVKAMYEEIAKKCRNEITFCENFEKAEFFIKVFALCKQKLNEPFNADIFSIDVQSLLVKYIQDGINLMNDLIKSLEHQRARKVYKRLDKLIKLYKPNTQSIDMKTYHDLKKEIVIGIMSYNLRYILSNWQNDETMVKINNHFIELAAEAKVNISDVFVKHPKGNDVNFYDVFKIKDQLNA